MQPAPAITNITAAKLVNITMYLNLRNRWNMKYLETMFVIEVSGGVFGGVLNPSSP